MDTLQYSLCIPRLFEHNWALLYSECLSTPNIAPYRRDITNTTEMCDRNGRWRISQSKRRWT
jgi:hypothetical protein